MEMQLPTRPGFRFLPVGREGAGMLPWVIAVMVYLTALALSASFGIQSAASDWTADLANRLTVQVVEPNDEVRGRQVDRALQLLRGTSGVAAANLLSAQETRALLEPWLGTGNISDDLPIPALIDVRLSAPEAVETAALRTALQEVAPAARLDDHGQWLGELSRFTGSLLWIALLVVVLVGLATASIVAFGTRAGLSSHRNTIEILHLMGAEDALIAREFQWRYLLHGLVGGLIGVAGAVGTILLVGWFAERLGSGLIGSAELPVVIWAAVLLLPVAAGVLTMLTARITVLRTLESYL